MKKNQAVFLLLALGLLVYGKCVRFEAVEMDDPKHIFENPYLLNPNAKNIIPFWTQPFFNLYIPLTYTAWTAQAALSKGFFPDENLKPSLFHASNVFFHLFNTILVFWFILHLQILRKKEDPSTSASIFMSFLGAFLFLMHPLQTEAVGWISGFKDVFSGFWGLLALCLYIKFKEEEKEGSRARDYFILATAAFILSLLSKPSLVVLPLILIVLEKFWLNQTFKQALKGQGIWLGFSLLFILVTHGVQPFSEELMVDIPLWKRVFVATDAICFYIQKIFLPFFLLMDYGRDPGYVWASGFVLITWIVPAAIALWCYLYRQRYPYAWVGILFFVISLLPVLGLIPFRFQIFSTVASRYVYLAMVGLGLIVAQLPLDFKKIKVWLPVAAISVFLCIQTWLELEPWRNSEALFTTTIKHNQRSYMAHNNLGYYYFVKEKPAKALAHFKKVALLNQKQPESLANLGSALVKLGRTEEGIKYFNEVLVRKPDSKVTHFNLIKAYMSLNDKEKAKAHAQWLARTYPQDLEVQRFLATLFAPSSTQNSKEEDRRSR